MSIRSASSAGLHLRGVALVAEPQVGRERVGASPGRSAMPAARALALVGDEVDLHLGARARRRCRCRGPRSRRRPARRARAGARASPRAPACGARPTARPVDARLADRAPSRRPRRRARAVVRRTRPDARARARRAPSASPSVGAALEREPRQRAVHRAGVEVAEAEPLGEPSRDRALARPRGAVDGDDHVPSSVSRPERSRSSKKPGKLIAAASAPSTSTPSRETRPGDRAEHRDPVVAVRRSDGRRAGAPGRRGPASRPSRADDAAAERAQRSVDASRSGRSPSRAAPPAPSTTALAARERRRERDQRQLVDEARHLLGARPSSRRARASAPRCRRPARRRRGGG